ncbi:MAG: SMC-Scp complex subunit ScpB [Candidatus Anstonellales archaeon]
MMDDEVIEGLLFLKPNGIPLDNLQDRNVQEIIDRLNEKYKDTVLWITIKNNHLIMEIKPNYVDRIAKYYENRELSDKQLKIIGAIKVHGKIPRSEATRKLSKEEFLELMNREFIRVEKIGRREFLVLGPGYDQYFRDRNAKN